MIQQKCKELFYYSFVSSEFSIFLHYLILSDVFPNLKKK